MSIEIKAAQLDKAEVFLYNVKKTVCLGQYLQPLIVLLREYEQIVLER